MYDGDWVMDKKHGKGVLNYATGDKYTGEYLDDKRHGKGYYVWKANGLTYDGDWVADHK